jgi:flagellar protein FliS
MSGFGAKAYHQVGIESTVGSADPHRLILMLFEAALQSISQAEAHLAARRIADKGRAIGKACRILNEGLRASVRADANPMFASRLVMLYDYAMLRLTQANLRNDAAPMREAHRILSDLRDAWVAIAPKAGAGVAAAAAPRPAAAPARAGYAPAASGYAGAAQPARRFTAAA